MDAKLAMLKLAFIAIGGAVLGMLLMILALAFWSYPMDIRLILAAGIGGAIPGIIIAYGARR